MTRFLLLFALFLSMFSFSQNIKPTPNTTISVITVGPGNALNDAFGHNGFRVKNEYVDVIYDYGNYNFNAPNFYLNFTRGKLMYLMGEMPSSDFITYYKSQNRSIKEQELNLNKTQKQQLIAFLEANLKPENKAYLYDFFFDNCATKIRDVSETVLKRNIYYTNPKTYKAETFRTLIQNNLNWNSWGSMGIDIALGSVIDQKATPREYMFLPENIFQFFNKAYFKDSKAPLIKTVKTLYKKIETPKQNNFFLAPLFILTLVGFFILWITYRDYKNKTRSKWLDCSVFIITGSIGVILLLLWFATDHATTANNYNILWAFPFSLFVIRQACKTIPKKWFISFLKLLVIMLLLLTLHWSIGVQRFAPTITPILIALVIRYIYIIKFYSKSTLLK